MPEIHPRPLLYERRGAPTRPLIWQKGTPYSREGERPGVVMALGIGYIQT